MTVLDGVCIPIERTAALNKWKMVGSVLVPGVLNVGDINNTDGMSAGSRSCRQILKIENTVLREDRRFYPGQSSGTD